MSESATTTSTSSPMKTAMATAPTLTSSSVVTTSSSATTLTSVSDNRTLMVNDLDVIQDMIDISAHRLEGLRTQCATSAVLTQQEIRSLETKLVRMFSELLITKARLKERIPAAGGLPNTTSNELRQWLRVVGLSQDTLNVCLSRLSTLEQLLEQSNEELRQLLSNNPGYREEEVRRLTKAMQSLRRCRDCLGTSGSGSTGDIDAKDRLTENLFWDSWDRHHHHRGSVGNIGLTASPRFHRLHGKQSKQQSQLHSSHSNRQSPCNDISARSATSIITMPEDLSSMHDSTLTMTVTPSPPSSPIAASSLSNFSSTINNSLGGSLNGTANTTPQRSQPKPFASTPPPMKKHQTMLATQTLTPTHTISSHSSRDAVPLGQQADASSVPSMMKLKNLGSQHDSGSAQFQDAISAYSSSGVFTSFTTSTASVHSPPSLMHTASSCSSNASTISRTRLNTDPSPESHYSSASSDIVSENNNNANNLQVPRSPCTPLVTLGMGHTISHRFKKVLKMMSTCDLCQKQMFVGFKCKECKYRCHKDCEPNVPPSCGLPREFVDEFKKTLGVRIDLQTIATGHGGGGGGSSSGGSASAIGTQQSSANTSPNLNTLNKTRAAAYTRRNKSAATAASANTATINHPESSSPGSSCNSSSPSSPALFAMQNQQQSTGVAAGMGSSISGSYIAGSGSSNIMSSSGGGSSSTSSNMLSTPSSFHKNSSQFNFPDVTITSNCNQLTSSAGAGNGSGVVTQMLYTSQQGGTATSDATQNDSSARANVAADCQDSASLTSSNKVTSNHVGGPSANAGNGTVTCDSEQSTSSTLTNTITVTSSNCNSVSLTSHHAPATSQHSNSSITSISISMVSAGTGSFYPRKLSSAGVDKRAPFSELSDTHKSNDSDKTVSRSGSTSASTDSDRTPVRLDSTEDGDSGNWPRQNSLSLKEWDIPYGDLKILEPIGKGRFGTVHRASWHGDVAVKLLKEDYLDDERTLKAFKLEVANFKKTRHENLVLFMGACMNPPHLAIVTSLCKGNTLYTYIHTRRDKFTINKTTLVAQQISQGMGYLHARGIFHKDLRTKNIFLENGKVIITDFGLFSSTKLLYCDIGLGVPHGWLCYLAPELMRALMPRKPSDEILPFSCASDVYSFGTVWYELLCGEFPFKLHPPESVIWQVGRGMKQTLANLQTSRDVKDILMLCWAFQADDRPDFPTLLRLLERLPKKRLARSPSHPVQLSRSAESVF